MDMTEPDREIATLGRNGSYGVRSDQASKSAKGWEI